MSSPVVLLDLDDTLIVEQATVAAVMAAVCAEAAQRWGLDPVRLEASVRQQARQRWYASAAADYCRRIGISSTEGLWGEFTGDDPHLKALREWAPCYRIEVWGAALAEQGVDDGACAEWLAEVYRARRAAVHVPFPEARLVLQELKRSCRLALVTNGAPDIQRTKLAAAGLEPWFDAILISGEVGVGKPDPAIFRLALERVAGVPDRAVMVGDNLRRDIQGARQAGLKTIWVNREGQPSDDCLVPDAVIRDLTELPRQIQAMKGYLP